MKFWPKFQLLMLLLFFTPSRGYTSDNISLSIEMTENSVQGRFDSVSVFVSDGFKEIGGFDILIQYKASALTFLGAHRGTFLDECGWEYFQYQFGGNGNCGTSVCPSGVLRIAALAETNNGAAHPSCFSSMVNDQLALLYFQISNNPTLECQYVPIRWIWYDCGDNSLVTRFRDSLLISRNIFDDGNTNIANAHDSLLYPTYYGAQDTDCGLTNSNMTIARSLDLYNGGFRFACPETLDARGDINLNGIPFEIADAVRYSNYFLYGQSAFSETTPFPLSATDVNGDGVPLTLADLVYFIRVVVGDARPPQELDTVEIDYTFEDDMVSVRLPIGAAYFNVVGDVNPTSYTSAQVRYAYDSSADLTKVLVYSMKVGNEIQGDFIRIPGDILYVEMATYDGAPVLAKRIHIPDGFVLLQNYPNPFNSSTVFSFGLPTPSDYKLTIYNTTGQLLETQTGTSEAGMVSLTWDAGEYASGVYFYRLQVGDFSETRKMVLLK